MTRPLTANISWRPFSSVPHVSDHLELHNNNRASWILHPGPSESDVYSDVVQEAQWNDLLHTARLLMCLDTPLHGNNARGAKYAVYYASVATHTVFENMKMAALRAMSEEKSCSPFPCFFIPCHDILIGTVPESLWVTHHCLYMGMCVKPKPGVSLRYDKRNMDCKSQRNQMLDRKKLITFCLFSTRFHVV